MDRDMVHRESPIARNNHDTIKNGFIVECDRIGGNHRLSARHLLTERISDRVLDRAYAIEWQSAAYGDREVDKGLLADRARAYLSDAHHARHARDNSGYLFCRTGR